MARSEAEEIEAWLVHCSPKVRRLVEGARARILMAVPEATEKMRPGWGLLGYNAPRYFAFIVAGSEDVRVGFEWGTTLKDPTHLLVGTGSQVRYFVVRTMKDLKAPVLKAWLREAAAFLPASRSSRSPTR